MINEKENYSGVDQGNFIEEWVEKSNRNNELIERWREYIRQSIILI